jgi:hypothetical protein
MGVAPPLALAARIRHTVGLAVVPLLIPGQVTSGFWRTYFSTFARPSIDELTTICRQIELTVGLGFVSRSR